MVDLIEWRAGGFQGADAASAAAMGTAGLCLRFELSLDEEHAWLAVLRASDTALDLGERIHHYSLATLARLRLQDARRGLDARSQGWVQTALLARMLGVDVAYVNIQIHRARHQFAEAVHGLAPARGLVERRRGELRLGDYAFTIERGVVLEGALRWSAAGALVAV